MTANELADELDLRRNLLMGKEHELGARAILLYGHSADMLCEQQTEIEKLGSELDRIVELYTDKAIENEALHRFIDERGETGQLIIWKAQEK